NVYERADKLDRAAGYIRDRLDEFAHVTTAESGKPLRQSRGEWSVAADFFEWFGEEAKRAYGRVVPARTPGRRIHTLLQPLGVAGVITAWNFPAYNPARSVAAALAAGCTVVCRPAEDTPLSGMLLAEAAEAAKLPPGVFNVISGDPAGMAGAMMADPACRKMSFTGSTRVGKLLMQQAAETLTGLALELGGNAPVLVFDDIDVEEVARSAVAAKFRNAGQVCISPQRIMVQESLLERFVEVAAEEVAKLKLGPGNDPETDVGPLINAKQLDRVCKLLDGAKSAGAKVHLGGERPDGPGNFLTPALVTGVSRDDPLWNEETFGPVMVVDGFQKEADALAEANRLEAGLAAYAFTNHLARAVRVYEGLDYGMVAVNSWVPSATEAPFPGWKQSGQGMEAGPEGLMEYLETKVVSLNL
ncbi:MAG: NAD-dependent succinate-semialdehyde dehydrogenase, partial [Planctomycetota bacterium]